MSIELAKKLSDMAELEQIRAGAIDDKITDLKPGMQAIKLSERDRHVARSGAFLEAARLALKPVLERTKDV